MELDKTTMSLIRSRMSGEYQGFPFVQASNHSYEFLGKPYYPLQIGKECQVIKTEIRTTTMMGKTQTETKIINYTFKVEGIEEITVPAGTFKCFKIVEYDDAGRALSTHWESNEVRQLEIKRIDHETEEVIELISLNSGLTRLRGQYGTGRYSQF